MQLMANRHRATQVKILHKLAILCVKGCTYLLSGKSADECEHTELAVKSESEKAMIVFQDTSFNVKVQAPGTEPFDMQVKFWTGNVCLNLIIRLMVLDAV